MLSRGGVLEDVPRGHILKSLALASKVKSLALALEASSPRKLTCPRLEDSTIFWNVKILWSGWKIFWKTFFSEDRLKNFCEDLFFFFGEHLRFVSLVLDLGLEHSCPWPRECLSSERLSLALASDFFCVLGLGLEPCVLDSTSDALKLRKGNNNTLDYLKIVQMTRHSQARRLQNH